MKLYLEWRLDKSNLFGFCFLRVLAGDTAVDVTDVVDASAVVGFDECDVQDAD